MNSVALKSTFVKACGFDVMKVRHKSYFCDTSMGLDSLEKGPGAELTHTHTHTHWCPHRPD
jgi:hypothetical protein